MPFLTRAGLAASIACAGCFFSPNLDGKVRCTPGSGCPPDLVCANDGFCRHASVAPDAAADGPAGDGSTCMDTFRTALPPNVFPRGLALDAGGLVYVVGREVDKAWVNTFETCLGQAGPNPAAGTSPGIISELAAVTLFADSVFVAGNLKPVMGDGPASDPGSGLYGRLTRVNLVTQFSQMLFGSTGVDEISAIASGASDLWMAGVANGQIWVVKGAQGGNACGSGVGSTSGGAGRAVVKSGADVYIGGTRDGQGILLRYPDSSCASSPPCGMCAPASMSPPIAEGTQFSEIRSLLVLGGQLYAAGLAADMATPADWFGFVVALNGAGTVSARYRWNPTAQRDLFLAIATDGQQIYAAGLQGWNGDSAGTGAIASLIALPLSLAVTGNPRAQTATDLATFWSIAADPGPGGGLYAAASWGVPEMGGYLVKLRKNP